MKESSNAKPYKFRTQFDPEYTGIVHHYEPGESMTVPDMALSLQQLLINHARGINSNMRQYEAQYFEDEVIPQLQDLTDLQESRRFLHQEKEALRDRVSDELKQKDSNVPDKTEKPGNEPAGAQETQQKNPVENHR